MSAIPGAGYLKGSVHYDQKAKRFFISIYWKGKRYRIWRHPATGEKFNTEAAARKQLSRIQCEIDEESFNPACWRPNSPLLMPNFCSEWLEVSEASPRAGYRGHIKNHIAPFFEKTDIRAVRYDLLLKFYRHMQDKVAQKTAYNVLSTLKTILRYAYRAEIIQRMPAFPELSYQLPEIEYLDFDQQARILAAIPERDRPIFEFMAEYGCRPGEARALQKDCITDDMVIIRRAFTNNILRETTKTKRRRAYQQTHYIREVFSRLPKHLGPFVFVRRDGKPYTGKDLNRIWRKAGEATGIKIKMYNGLRHSLGCQLLNGGEDLDLVREVLGHTKAEMTRRYARRDVSALGAALDRRRNNVNTSKRGGNKKTASNKRAKRKDQGVFQGHQNLAQSGPGTP